MYSFILQTDLVYCCPFSFIHSLSFGRSRSMSRSRPCSKVKYIYDTACCKNSNSSGYNAGKTYLDDWFMLLIHSYLITTGSVYTVDAAQSYT